MWKLDANGFLSATLAKLVVTGVALGGGISPLFIDLNRTHATHPIWPGHARFHVVWQTATAALLGLLETALLWWPGGSGTERFYLAAGLTIIPLVGFALALLTRRRYGGTLHDPQGMKPLRMGSAQIDMNAVLVLTALAMLAAAMVLFRLAG